MGKPKGVRIVKWSAALVAVAIVTYFAVGVLSVDYGVLPLLPAGKDSRLVGTWSRNGPARVMVLRADGKGRFVGRPVRPLSWGTHGDQLIEKYFSVDAYTVDRYRFEVSPDGRKLTLYSLDVLSKQTYVRQAN